MSHSDYVIAMERLSSTSTNWLSDRARAAIDERASGVGMEL